MDVAFAEPERSGYAPGLEGDRAWQVAEGATVVWCIVDAAAQAALLEAVLGGPGAERPTSIERSIVGETMERLFAHDSGSGSRIAEVARERPIEAEWWRCNVDLTPRRGRSATLQLFAPPTQAVDPPTGAAPDLRAVPIFVSVETAPISIPLAHVLAWTPGALVQLPSAALNTAMVAAHPGVWLASGRLGSIGDDKGAASRAFEISALHRGGGA
jgi:hypothetical protein